MPDGRQLLRHTVATLAYRASKAVRNAPPGFSIFQVAPGSRTPGQILAHLGDLMDWALSQARGQQKWTDTPPGDWNADVDRFFRSIGELDAYLGSDADVNFGARRLERPVPQGREQRAVLALAQAIRALATHPCGGGGFSHATRGSERIEEVQLALGRPAVAADSAALV